MKKAGLLFTLFLSIISFATSCGDDNEEAAPALEGTWYTKTRNIKTNYPEFDKRINLNLQSDIQTYTIKRIFSEKFKDITTSATLPGTTIPKREKLEDYTLIGNDSIQIQPKGSYATRWKYIVSRTALTMQCKVSKVEIFDMLVEIGIDPNIGMGVPNDIEGTLYMREIR